MTAGRHFAMGPDWMRVMKLTKRCRASSIFPVGGSAGHVLSLGATLTSYGMSPYCCHETGSGHQRDRGCLPSRNGASNLLLRFVDRGMVTPLCSTALFLEYEAVLSREEIRQATAHKPWRTSQR